MLRFLIFVAILNFGVIIAFPQRLNFPQYDIRTNDWHYIQQPYRNPWIPQQSSIDDDRSAQTAFSENLCKRSKTFNPFLRDCVQGSKISKTSPKFSNQEIRGKKAYLIA